MGNQNNSGFFPDHKIMNEFPTGFQFLGPSTNPRYGDGVVFKHISTKQLIFQKKIHTDSFNETWKKAFANLSSIKHPNIVRFLGFQDNQNYPICGSGIYQIDGFYEYLPSSLKIQLEHRIHFQQNFKEQEIWYILLSIIEAQNYLNKSNKYIGDISLESILINSHWNIKFLPLGALTSDINIVQKYQQQQLKYIDPEIANFIEIGKFDDINLMYKLANDLYALAITILQLMSLKSFGMSILLQKEFLEKTINSVKSQYSSQLIKFINILLLHYQDRPTAGDLYKILSVYSQQIGQFQSFKISKQDILNSLNNEKQTNDIPITNNQNMEHNIVQNEIQTSKNPNIQSTNFNQEEKKGEFNGFNQVMMNQQQLIQEARGNQRIRSLSSTNNQRNVNSFSSFNMNTFTPQFPMKSIQLPIYQGPNYQQGFQIQQPQNQKAKTQQANIDEMHENFMKSLYRTNDLVQKYGHRYQQIM